MHTHLRIPYDACAKHIQANLHKQLQMRVIPLDVPDVVYMMPIERIQDITIMEMKEGSCDDKNCIIGLMTYNHREYRFRTYQKSYDVLLFLESTYYPFQRLKIILPLSSYDNAVHSKIYIPPRYTSDVKIVPIEFIWEFLTQLPAFLYSHPDADDLP